MRYAIYSDIHANLEALLSVLTDIESQKVDTRLCLGDVVGYCAKPNECADLVGGDAEICIAGNHDFAALKKLPIGNFNVFAKAATIWTQEAISEQTIAFLDALPIFKKLDSMLLVHASPYAPERWSYVATLEQAEETFYSFDTRFCFVGHTHIPYIMVGKGEEEKLFCEGSAIRLNAGERCLVNVGSVGQPRDRNPKSCYVIVDTNEGTVELRRVKYDIKKTQEQMKKANFPDYLISRLSIGR